MRTPVQSSVAVIATAMFVFIGVANAQQHASSLPPDVIAKRKAIEADLESIAVVDRKVMVPMSDGKRMATDIYRPKDTSKKYPIIFVRTPYNFNYWDVQNGVPRDLSTELDAVKRGYAYVEMNERGHFFSEGNYDILGAPLSDGNDAIELDGCTALEQRQGRDDRVFFDSRVATSGGGAGQSGFRGDDSGEFRGRCWARRSLL